MQGVKKKLAFLVGVAFGLALFELLRRRRPAAELPPAAAADPRAEELRRRLAQAREETGPEPRESDTGAASELERARQAVYEDARATLDDMRGAGL